MLIGEVLQLDLVKLPYEDRLSAILDRKLGLWDVVAKATRQGSLDTALGNIQMHDMDHLLAAAPGIKAVGFNGGVAWRQAGFFDHRGIATIRLPSSSPAHVRPYAEKRDVWLQLKQFLE